MLIVKYYISFALSMSARRRKSMARLGMIGGLLGLIMAIVAFIVGGIGSLFHFNGSYELFHSSWTSFFLSIVGIAGAGITRKDALIGGVTMLVSGLVGIAIVGGIYIVPFLILLIAAIVVIIDSFS